MTAHPIVMCLVILTGGFLFYLTVAAAMRAEGIAKNSLSMAQLETRIVEDYRVPPHLMPGTRVKKVVHVKNTGNVDAIVRVRVEKALGILDGDGSFLPQDELNPDWIEIDYDDSGTWVLLEDGYFYYTKVLQAGKMSEKPLIKSFSLSTEAKNPCKGKEGRIDVHMESVQAEADAVSLWGRTKEELGILYEAAIEEAATDVEFASFEEGFLFHPVSTDLFSSFQSLCPGSERTQLIRVKNQSGEKIRISLHAAPAVQETKPEDIPLVEEVLRKYARIKVTLQNADQDTVYEGAADGNPLHERSEEASLGTPVSLGEYLPGEEKNIKVFLDVSPEMDNRYMSLLAKVDWIFEAAGQMITATPTPDPGQSLTITPTPDPGQSPTITPALIPVQTVTVTPTPGPAQSPTVSPTRVPPTPTIRPQKTPTPYPGRNTAATATPLPWRTPTPQGRVTVPTDYTTVQNPAVTHTPASTVRRDVYPDTADHSDVSLYALILCLSFTAAMLAGLRKKRREG